MEDVRKTDEESAEQVETFTTLEVCSTKHVPISEKVLVIPKTGDGRRANEVGLTRYVREESGVATSFKRPSRQILAVPSVPSPGREGRVRGRI